MVTAKFLRINYKKQQEVGKPLHVYDSIITRFSDRVAFVIQIQRDRARWTVDYDFSWAGPCLTPAEWQGARFNKDPQYRLMPNRRLKYTAKLYILPDLKLPEEYKDVMPEDLPAEVKSQVINAFTLKTTRIVEADSITWEIAPVSKAPVWEEHPRAVSWELQARATYERYGNTVEIWGSPGIVTVYLLSHLSRDYINYKLINPFSGHDKVWFPLSGIDTAKFGLPNQWYFKISLFPPNTQFPLVDEKAVKVLRIPVAHEHKTTRETTPTKPKEPKYKLTVKAIRLWGDLETISAKLTSAINMVLKRFGMELRDRTIRNGRVITFEGIIYGSSPLPTAIIAAIAGIAVAGLIIIYISIKEWKTGKYYEWKKEEEETKQEAMKYYAEGKITKEEFDQVISSTRTITVKEEEERGIFEEVKPFLKYIILIILLLILMGVLKR